MEHGELPYKVVMDDGPDTAVLARLADLEMGAAAYMAAVLKHPKRNIQLRQGARIIKRHDGEPAPQLPPDPRLPDWDANLIVGSKNRFLGSVMAADEASAIKLAIEHFNLTGWQVERLMVSPRR